MPCRVPFWLLLGAVLLLTICSANSAASTTCGFASEGHAANLSCPQGSLIQSVDWAIFGEFESNSTCATGLHPTTQCPTTVRAQAELLCVKRSSCSVSCLCNARTNPPCLCSSGNISTAVPAWPCNGIPKALAMMASCAPSVAVWYPPVSGLLLEFMPSPVRGLDQLKPHFSWSSSAPQTAFRVNVTSDTGAVWSSGRVVSPTPLLAAEAPLPLKSDTVYMWTVETWSGASPPVTSDPAEFSTGLLHQSDWAARWIDAGACAEPPGWTQGARWLPEGHCKGGMLRRDFSVDAVPARVSLFVSGCHYYEVLLDGRRVGTDAGITNSWTRFNLFRSYASLAVDPSVLQPGKHTIGVHVGQGFCGEPQEGANMTGTRAVLLQLSLYDTTDALAQQVVTDPSWQIGQSPLVWESAYYGERYHSVLEQPGWSVPDFKNPWPNTRALQYEPTPFMSSQLQPPIRAVRTLPPISISRVLANDYVTKSGPGALASPARWTFDFGQEFSGHVRLRIPPGVPNGTNFTLSFGEVLAHPPLQVVVRGQEGPNVSVYDGSVYQGNLFWANQVDVYQSWGSAAQTYQPRFTYHAFRYVELSVNPPLPKDLEARIKLGSLLGINLRTAAREQARMDIANPLLWRLSSSSWWTEASGLIGMPHGAGARGERAGWTGDAAAASESEAFDFDSAAFFIQYLTQIAQTSCKADGTIGNCVPNTDPRRDGSDVHVQPDPATCSGLTEDPTWGTVYVTITHNVWKYYGAINVVRAHYRQLTQYMNTLESRKNSTGLGQMFCNFGDWNPVVHTPCSITAALSYIHDVRRMAELAGALGNSADEAVWQHKSDELTQEFHSGCNLVKGRCIQGSRVYGGFWNGTQYLEGSQMASSAALWLGAMPAERRTSVLSGLLRDLSERGLTVGFVGVQYMFEVLVRANHTGAALECLLRESFPGYGYAIFNKYEPATTLWESWTGDTMAQWVAESSRSHHCHTSINTFLRKYVAGLQMPHGAAAWSVVKARPEAALLAPSVASRLPSASVAVQSHRGVVALSWQRLDGRVELNCTVPATSLGEVHVPLLQGMQTTVRLGSGVLWRDGELVGLGNRGSEGVVRAAVDAGFVVFETVGGEYAFVAE